MKQMLRQTPMQIHNPKILPCFFNPFFTAALNITINDHNLRRSTVDYYSNKSVQYHSLVALRSQNTLVF
jgi:hypothetical protein